MKITADDVFFAVESKMYDAGFCVGCQVGENDCCGPEDRICPRSGLYRAILSACNDVAELVNSAAD